ncbi:hypothetical protein KAF25_011001 [Fusarium avenaceum]|uniref:NACHT domain-containing protein n=1 Tax=Fusarium avenaceum TaxID=40199 RepID=A0A9P7GRR5_9HYPO|nr:hypothetical protein KAF25_011001 [Fusarium avenaceum]
MAFNSNDQVSEIFEKAKINFLKEIKEPKVRTQLQNATTIDDVWEYTEQLQTDQGNTNRLRGLKKIGPYIERLQEYAGVIEVFVQVKPDVLALIWGPIKLLLQISSNLVTSFDAILGVMKDMGSVLPRFDEFIPLFKKNERMKYVLGLFFQDILDFYLISLRFFGLNRWKVFFESLWPARRSEIQVIAQNIEKHRLLLCNEITLNDVLEAHTARQKALEHYAEAREFQERQDFHSMETYIRPPSYDEDLDRIRNGRCEGTGSWLLQDKQFINWAEGKDKAPQILWLQGIPGAGKTYLASIAVDRIKALGHSLFAFLSYRHDLNSPLPILHALIFQLAFQGRDLRSVLCSTIKSTTKDLKRDLKGDSKFALETLFKLLEAAGPIYITIDGLDEVSDSVQQIFLHQLLDVLKDIPHVKVLISSRRVERIERLVKSIAATLSIDLKNAGCIETYVTRRGQEWLDNSSFDSDFCLEIQQLLKPLAAKAEGMFLYVRIVLESIEMLLDLNSIREQLKVLPESLDEAYKKVLERIMNKSAAAQSQSKKILSWIACSPIEITRHEMEQALIIQPGQSTIPQVRFVLDTLRLCGPLVVIEDERLKFVHFTVKEYLLEHEKKFLEKREALLEISATCLTYLCSDVLDPELSDKDMEQNMALGSYRLLNFAHSQWAECLRLCINNFRDEVPSQLISLLDQITTDRSNPYCNQESDTNPKLWSLDNFKCSPNACNMISRCLDFLSLMNSSYDWRLDEGGIDWADFDPTTISATAIRAYRMLERLLCHKNTHEQDCKCLVIQKHYGSVIHRCPFLTCRFHQLSFETRAIRDGHIKHHDRPFKCWVQACEYSTLGFSTAAQRERHQTQSHFGPIDCDVSDDFDSLPEEHITSILMDAITRNQVDGVARILPYVHQRNIPVKELVMDLVGSQGSIAMARLVIEDAELHRAYEHDRFVCHAIEGNNLPVLKWALTMDSTRNGYISHGIGQAIMSSNSIEVFNIWREHVLTYGSALRIFNNNLLPSKSVPVTESLLAAFWIEQHAVGNIPTFERRISRQQGFGELLKSLAMSNCSVVLARALIACGADVNYRSRQGNNDTSALTPLHCAMRKRTPEAAYLVEYLLLSGADPNIQVNLVRGKRKGETVTLPMEPGAKNISKWLGKTWDELVEFTAAKREEDIKKGGSSLSTSSGDR